jgi:hypothetical protein
LKKNGDIPHQEVVRVNGHLIQTKASIMEGYGYFGGGELSHISTEGDRKDV